MGEVVNLRRARKSRMRRQDEEEAARNRLAFGRPKAERQRAEQEREKLERDLEGHKLDRADDP